MVLILDDHPLARQGISSLLQVHKNDEEILHASTVGESMKIAEEKDISIAFVDLNLTRESGFDFIEWLKDNNKPVKVFIITSSSRRSDFIHAQELGVDVYVLKDAFIDEIMFALKVVEKGGKFFSSALMERMYKNSEEDSYIKTLTERETEIFLMISKGYSNAKISEALFISEGTTKKHISNILSKLGLKNRVQAAVFANENAYAKRLVVERSMQA